MGSAKKIFLIFVSVVFTICIAGFIINGFNKAFPAVNMVSERVLIPGGQSVGIKMDVKGALVVGLEEIETEDDIKSPGLDSGIQIGDIILSVDDKPVSNAADLAERVKESTSTLDVKVQRNKDTLNFKINPVIDYITGERRLGIWVKEKIAGIGTLTFYDPQTDILAALGHGIYEINTGTLLEAGDGHLLNTEVKSVKEGRSGKPGELRGIFYGGAEPAGEILLNSQFGIYSKALKHKDLEKLQPMIMATQDIITTGDAYILTTIQGNEVEKFSVRVTKVNKQDKPEGKGLEIEVTDERLLSYCGGIVQGMSGSPIIQNNRIIGAITHVFVDNPQKGYGIFAEWMIKECESI